MKSDRERAVDALANWDGPLTKIQSDLDRTQNAFAPLELDLHHVCALLRRYLRDELDAPLSRWARSVLFTDDLTYVATHNDEIAELINRVAVPEIEGGELSEAEATEWLSRWCPE